MRFAVVDGRSDRAVWAMTQYFQFLDDRFPGGFDPGDAVVQGAAAFDPPGGVFVVAVDEDVTVGCGGVQFLEDGIGEIKRMWVAATVRGRGVGRALLQELEEHARRLGYATVRLDTNSALPEAIALYRSHGYVEIDRYNDGEYPDHFFEKSLTSG